MLHGTSSSSSSFPSLNKRQRGSQRMVEEDHTTIRNGRAPLSRPIAYTHSKLPQLQRKSTHTHTHSVRALDIGSKRSRLFTFSFFPGFVERNEGSLSAACKNSFFSVVRRVAATLINPKPAKEFQDGAGDSPPFGDFRCLLRQPGPWHQLQGLHPAGHAHLRQDGQELPGE